MSLLSPSSIAVIGASADPKKVGHAVLQNLLIQGFCGSVFPVNPKGGEILGREVYASIAHVPQTPDLAVVITPAATVPGILLECAAKGTRNVIVISAGFGETRTDEGIALEREVRRIARMERSRLIGPNCLGLLVPGIQLNASFARELPPAGNIALLSQSGATAVGLMDEAARNGLGFSFVLSIGNKTVFDEADALLLACEDPLTRVIGLYLEGIHDGRKFLKAIQENAGTKPIVLLKSGVSPMGKKAAASHTGALAGSDAGLNALALQTGLIRAKTLEEFLDFLQVLSHTSRLATPNIVIVTNAGGPGILAADAAASAGLLLPPLSKKQETALKAELPPAASVANPIDVLGDADAARYEAGLEAAAKDPGIDGICVLLTPQIMTPAQEVAKAMIAIQKTHPLLPIVTSFMGEEHVEDARKMLRAAGVPSFATPERAIRALAVLHSSPIPRPPPLACPSEAHERRWRVEKSGVEEKKQLPEKSTRELCVRFGIPLPKQLLAHTCHEAAAAAEKIGFPVIAKIRAPAILHKTDIGAVRGNLETTEAVQFAFDAIMESVKAQTGEHAIEGVLIQEFIPNCSEFIVGMVHDPAFGPLVMVGLGGIYTEIFRDTTFRMAPIREEEAYRMLQELKSWPLLLGSRGKPQSDIPALARLICAVSKIAEEEPDIIEIDLNPVLVSQSRIVAADVKFIA